MSLQELIQILIDQLVSFASHILLPVMGVAFGVAIVFRALIYFTVRREEVFTAEFEKRVNHLISSGQRRNNDQSFFVTTKRLLEKTYYEMFETSALLQRRRPDLVMPLSDRLFLIKQGAAILVRDTLRQIKYIKFNDSQPQMLQVSRVVIQNNPCFMRVLGVLPSSKINDIVNILPSMFIVAGIFGTFLGIMKALPELGMMDLNDIEGTKSVMDQFLLKISFAMSTSIFGIILSVGLTIFNAIFNPEKSFVHAIERYENTLNLLWNQSDNNKLPEQIPNFDEYRDPSEALAEQALNEQLREKSFFGRTDSKKTASPTHPPSQKVS
jgi:biopolymer transport protein ExbB/TolQ